MKLILDMDTGIDDAFALCYALGHPDIELLGVTCTYGNVDTPVGVRNVLDILQLFGRDDIAVYEGLHDPLESRFVRNDVARRIHGSNGVGEVCLDRSVQTVEAESAVSFVKRMILEHGQELVIVTTGPMTNIAQVLKQDPSLAIRFARIVAMGGALTVEGNVSPYAEANIYKDPLAVQVIMESGVELVMVGLDVTMRSRFTKADVKTFRSIGTASGSLFASMLDYYIDNTLGTEETYIHDPSAVVCALQPQWFSMLHSMLTIRTQSSERGRIVVDPEHMRDPKPHHSFCIDVDARAVHEELMTTLVALFSKA